MITLTISQETPLTDLTITDTGTVGSAGYVLRSITPAASQAENRVAESSFVDGGVLVARRRGMRTLELTVQVNAATMDALITAIAALTTAVDQFGYTVTASGTLSSEVYTCLPASWGRAYDRYLMRLNSDLVALSIPVQP